jgi:Na+-transporting NADH:ubiquinone oxidoreductase subunit A
LAALYFSFSGKNCLTRIRIKKGLDIPLTGEPEQRIDEAQPVRSVAVLGPDIVGLRARMQVDKGDRVRLGQALFTDRQNPDVPFTAPGAGIVEAVNRGAKRALQSVVIRLDGDDADTYLQTDDPASLSRDDVRENLIASGLWTAFRTRPFSKVPAPASEPGAIFVTAIDTNPHAADPAVVIADASEAFTDGLHVVEKLTSGQVHVVTKPGSGIAIPDGFNHAEFSGPHPAGLVGTHIHFLHPVGENETVWHLGYQDVIACGRLFRTGRLNPERIIATGGPLVKKPRLLRTRLGANITELLAGELEPAKKRIISGSILNGRRATGPICWLGRYHTQVSVLADGGEREFLAWARPGHRRFSSLRAFASHILHRGGYDLTTSQNGSPRAMVSIGTFERVMPLDILATPLLKALLVTDTDSARDLGCLELDEEDLALCSFVCNGKYEYGPFLRESLTEIEVNG